MTEKRTVTSGIIGPITGLGRFFEGFEPEVKAEILSKENVQLWDWKKQNELLKTRCIGCELACSEKEKLFCDPDGGAAK